MKVPVGAFREVAAWVVSASISTANAVMAQSQHGIVFNEPSVMLARTEQIEDLTDPAHAAG